MNANVVNVAVVDGKTITQTVELSSVKNGQPVRIKAVQGGKYILAEGANGVAPENITIKRVGKDLHIALEGSDPDQPQLIIEDFEGSGGQLVGVAEDGSYHEYISSDAEQDRSAAFLIEGVEAPQVLGAQPLPGFGDGLAAAAGIGWFWPALLGLAALGVLGGVYAANRDDGGNDDVPGSGNTDKGSIGGVDDNVGDKQGLIENGGSTDDRTPTFTGEGKPGTSVEIIDNGKTIGTAIVGEDGKWEYTPPVPGLDDGKHEIIIVPVDKDGNKGEPSPGYEIIVDTVAPSQPLIDGLFDDVAPQEGQIGIGGHTNDTTPTLSGTGEAGSTIHIYDNGVEIGTALADADGKWSFTPDPALTEGPHEFTVTAEDAAGNISTPSLPFPIIVDITGPGKPGTGTGGIDDILDNVGTDQGSIGDGDSTDDTTPTLIGSGGEPGDIVTIIDNGTAIGTAVVGEDGKWEFTPDPELTEGSHELVVVITDPAGNESEPSDPQTIIVDITPPGKPGVGTGGIEDVLDNVGTEQGSIDDGETTDDTTPTLIGSGGEPGDIVTIIDNGTEIGTAVVGEDGKWEFTPDPELSEGSHELVVVITDPAGNESEPSDPHTIIVDITPPGKPGVGTGGIEDILDDVGPIQGSIDDGDSTDDTTPTLVGSGAEPGDTVTIIDNGTEIGTAIVGSDGKWEFTPNPALTEGPHEFVVVISDPAGNQSEPSDPHTIIVDITAPGVPTLDRVVDDQGAWTGDLASTDTTDDASPDLSGTAVAGSLVTIYDNGVPIGSVIATNGTWTFTPTVPLTNGPHTLTVTASDAAGNESAPTQDFILDIMAGGVPPAPAIISVMDDQGSYQGPLSQNDFTDDAQPTINGTGANGTVVTLFANGLPVGSATVVNGQWSITPTTALAQGLNNLSAVATDAAGNPSPSTGDYPINVDTLAPGTPTGQTLYDDVGVPGFILSGDSTDDANPTFSGMAEAGSVVVIYDNGNPIGSTTADPTTGAWSYTPATALVDGAHSFAAQAVDSAGNASPMGPSIPFTVDTSAVVISITSVMDDVGTFTGALNSGQATDDTTPTLNGQATPGGIVTIYDGINPIGTAIADAITGQWSFTTPVLSQGPHNLTATVTTQAAGESAPTSIFVANIDTTAPLVPTIDDVTDDVGAIQGPVDDGDPTDDSTPTLSGSGLQAGDVVMVYDNGQLIGSAPVDANGDWSYTPTTPLNDGSHAFTVVAVDPAGNASAPSAPWTVEIDTAVPLASAVVDSMGKDSGADSGDFVTNDGSAGRLIQGSLTATLGAGEKVQISNDGGSTWVDVIVNGRNWTFIDQDSHSSDWTIQTRVVDAAGNANLASQSISLDDSAPDAPDSFAINGTTVTVAFDGSSLVAGDTILLVVGSERFEQTLTQAQIDAGSVDVVTTAGVSMANTSATFIDQSGNSSQVLTFHITSVDFENSTPVVVGSLGSIDFGVFTFRWNDSNGHTSVFPQGIVAAGFALGEGLVTPSIGLGAWGGVSGQNARLTLNGGETATEVTFRIGDLTSVMTLRFFNAQGGEIHTVSVPSAPGNTIQDISATLPAGLEFSYMEFDTSWGQHFWLDDFVLQGSSRDGFEKNDPTAAQTIDGAGAYYGGDAENVFSLSDVANLDNVNTVVNGGAGTDTLSLTGTNQVLDLVAITGKLESIEIIDITGTGNNTLNLSLGDVLEQGETSLFTADETTQMMVKGNAGDVVNLDDLLPDGTDPGDWAASGTATVAGVTYNVFQHSTLDAQLLVQDGVTTNLV
ncbi:Ig-like domain-containing protein [Pseudomonas sp. L13]|uniref:Ig-like domain-containing protein n=1 Tax=Pseudomonas sp. L13 TaxID=343985 RepID=UPI00137AAB08|nr:Ig-like domain-containing protein [Pseudomonas sp. L13]NCE89724.1 Biofilm associated protein A [Pseudomonas sp. L13]